MKKLVGIIVVSALGMLSLDSCVKRGCTDPMANNYNEQAQLDDQSCNYKRGCTNCQAVNYDSLAVSGDGSCEYAEFGYSGTYTVIDSLILPSMDVERDTYELLVSRDTCGAYTILLSNYANVSFSSNEPLVVSAQFDSDSIRIVNQTILGPSTEFEWDQIQVYESTGFFSGDSITLPLHFATSVSTYFGGLTGNQK